MSKIIKQTRKKTCKICDTVFIANRTWKGETRFWYQSNCPSCTKDIKTEENLVKYNKKCTHVIKYKDECLLCSLININPHLEASNYVYTYMS